MGLFGKSRTKSIWDIIGRSDDLGPIDPGLNPDAYGSGGYTPAATSAEESPAYLEHASSAHPKGFNWGRAAMGFFGGPGVASALRQKDALDLQQQKYDERQAANDAMQQSVRGALKARGYKDTDIDAIMANPENASKLVTEALVTRQGGADGMSISNVDPATGQRSTSITPGWHDGNFFGGSDGTQVPQRMYQGEKVFPVEKGGYLGVIGGPAGASDGGQSAPTAGAGRDATLRAQAAEAIQKGADPAEVARELQRQLGGAGPQAPRPFRSGLFGR